MLSGPAAQEEILSPMRLQPTLRSLWLLPILLTGCTSTMGSRVGVTTNPPPKTIAVVGDHPLPAATGEAGSKVVADVEEPEPRRNPATRISGRVVDEAGDPVAGATVRLADGTARGGREIVGRTDRSGAFTLNGLRPGSSYELIAEGEDEHGPIVGRVEASTAQTGVKIALVSEEKRATTRRSARPSKARTISKQDATDDRSELDEPRINREDLDTPARESDAVDPGPPEPTPTSRPRLSAPDPGIGWKNKKTATASRTASSDLDDESATSDTPTQRRKVAQPPVAPDQDEEENPLPPAVDRNEVSRPAASGATRSRGPDDLGAIQSPQTQAAGEIAFAPEARPTEKKVESEVSALASLMPELKASPGDPPAMPPVGGESVQLVANDAPGPTPSPPVSAVMTQDDSPPHPAPQPVFASQAPALKPVEKPASTADYNPFANLPPPSLAAVATAAPLVPAREEVAPPPAEVPPVTPKTKWGDVAASSPKPATPAAPAARATLASSILRRIRPTAEVKESPSVASCSYDPRLRKLNDFRLPDLEGKPVRFQELDADFVLLDFWGTWCEPCLDSIPHLIQLQKKYGPGKLKVVGIACEQAPPEQRKAKVDEAARKLGINYPILLSNLEGKPCPVQQAFQIQAMPTMILLDRKGEVLWRNSGSTTASETRLDKVLALAMSRNDSARR